MYALRRQEGLEDRPPRAQRPPLGSPVSWLFVLPRFARRPARFMRRLMRGDRKEIEAAIEREMVAFGEALRSDDAKAAFTAFLSKSKG